MLLRYKDFNNYTSGSNSFPHRFFTGRVAGSGREAYHNARPQNQTLRCFQDIVFPTSLATSERRFFSVAEYDSGSSTNSAFRLVDEQFAYDVIAELDPLREAYSWESASRKPMVVILVAFPNNIFRAYANGMMLGEFTHSLVTATHYRFQYEINLINGGAFKVWIGNELKLNVTSDFRLYSGSYYIKGDSVGSTSSFAIWDDRDDGVDFFKGFLPDFKISLLDATSQGTENNGEIVITQGLTVKEYNPLDYGTYNKLTPFNWTLQYQIPATGHPYFSSFYVVNRYSNPGTDLYKFQTQVGDTIFGTGKPIIGILYRAHLIQSASNKAEAYYVVKNGAQRYEFKEDNKIFPYTTYLYSFLSEFSPFQSFAKNPFTNTNWTDSDLFNYEFGIKYSKKP